MNFGIMLLKIIKFLRRNKKIKKELSSIGQRMTKYELSLIDKTDINDVICPNCDGNHFVSIGNTISFQRQYHCKQCGMMYEIRLGLTPKIEDQRYGVNHGKRNAFLDLSLNRILKVVKVQKELKNKEDGEKII